MGTYIVSITKVDSNIWKSLSTNGERRPIWNEAVVKHPKDME